MQLNEFLDKVKNHEPVSFNETIAVIAENYHYTPSTFSNGLGEQQVVNIAGTNEGSCKIFAFALLHGLTEQQTLNLFDDYYRQDVLNAPDGTSHANIRNFMRFGWTGIQFATQALQLK